MGKKTCSIHVRYQAGCEHCKMKSREYTAQKEGRKVEAPKESYRIHGSEEIWRKMTEIGQRWEREGSFCSLHPNSCQEDKK